MSYRLLCGVFLFGLAACEYIPEEEHQPDFSGQVGNADFEATGVGKFVNPSSNYGGPAPAGVTTVVVRQGQKLSGSVLGAYPFGRAQLSGSSSTEKTWFMIEASASGVQSSALLQGARTYYLATAGLSGPGTEVEREYSVIAPNG